jgi:WhiB family redox-sensing transcriptional regulator
MIENILGTDYPDFTSEGPAPCSESWPDAFFSDDLPEGAIQRRNVYSMEYEAKKTCFSCPYRAACLTYALKYPDLQGIWGGTTENQRNSIRKGKPVSLELPSPNRRR